VERDGKKSTHKREYKGKGKDTTKHKRSKGVMMGRKENVKVKECSSNNNNRRKISVKLTL